MKKGKVIKEINKKPVQKVDRLLPPRLVRFVAIVIVVILLAVGAKVGFDIYNLKKHYREALDEKAALELRAAELQKQVEAMNTPEYLEQQARNVLHMIKPGEILYIPPKDGSSNSSSTNAAVGKPDDPEDDEPTKPE